MPATVVWRKNKVFHNDVDLFGNVEKGSLEIKRKFVETGGIGTPALAKVPTGKFEPLSATFTFNNISPTIMRHLLSNGGFCNFRMVGECHMTDASVGLVKSDRLTSIIRGYAENLPIPEIGSEDKMDAEVIIHALFIEIKDNSGTLLMVDIPNGLVEPKALG